MGELPTIVRPVWSDPRFIAGQNETSVTNVNTAPSGPVLVARNNPSRWAIGFSHPPGATIGTTVMFTTDPTGQSGGFEWNGQTIWLTLFTHGPMVCQEWYAVDTTGAVITVLETFNS